MIQDEEIFEERSDGSEIELDGVQMDGRNDDTS